jgi:sugar/nucleoside kinase (ribokinase family)
MAHILVIGGTSLDRLHITGQQVESAGGAGMYTAMAAQRYGVQASLFAPRPSPMPSVLQPVADRLTAWHGPIIQPNELAHFEILHQGRETTYLEASVGVEASLIPDQLPPDLSKYDCIHIIPLGDARRQLTFLQGCRQRGAKRISVGTAMEQIIDRPQVIRRILEQADFFFLNQNEAIALFGSLEVAQTQSGKMLFVTLGKAGALILQGTYCTQLDTIPSNELDPTGAGDTFCGATLANLIQGQHPVMAARSAMPLAAQMTEQIGPMALFWSEPPPAISIDPRVIVNQFQIQRIADLIVTLPEVRPFNFTGDEFPPVGNSAVLDLFFASTLQQFGFWTSEGEHYHQPLIASINGALQKGSTYLAQAYLRRLNDPAFFTPTRQANLTRPEMLDFFRSDDGTYPMPALELHLEQARNYGQNMLALQLTPQEIIQQTQTSSTPLQTFLAILDQIGGYKEDPLRKKSGLLALILNQRPENFITFGEGEQLSPVIDYHLMRSCLRVGLVEIVDDLLRAQLVSRQIIQSQDEWAVRYAAYQAIEQVVAGSGKSMGAVDWFFFNARKRCPEMTEPDCQQCPVDPVCMHNKIFFQPVLRTTFY